MARRPPPSIAVPVVAELIGYAATRGGDVPGLCRVAGLSPEHLREREGRVPIARLFDVWAAVMRSLDDVAIPVHIAMRSKVEKFGLLGFLLLTSGTGRECLERGKRFSRLFTDSGRWVPQDVGDTLGLRWEREGDRSLGHRCANEAAVLSFVQLLRQVFGRPVTPLRVAFRHPAPRDLSEMATFLGVAPRFGQLEDVVWLDRDLLAWVPRGAEPGLNAFLEAQAQTKLDVAGSEGLAGRVRAAIAQELPAGLPTVPRLVKRLGVSERSLRRYLQDEGTSFRTLVEHVRRERAEDLLRFGSASVGEIAFALGFSDPGTFGRAFRRWTNVPPGEFRERSRA